jgi:glycosyltransferase involved in cell wall biosynthesis
MKILYISCHAILEYDEVKLFSEMGYDVFSAGVYAAPWFRPGMPRPGIDTLTHYPDLERLASTIDTNGGAIPQELIEWADTIIFMHRPEWIEKNWAKLKHKRVIYRSIGQSVGHTERVLTPLRAEGLQIVRYSPKEREIPSYAGEDAVIRFYKDPEEYAGYTGLTPQVINVSQSLTQRREFCHLDEIMYLLKDFPAKIYGTGNEDLGPLFGGSPTEEGLRQVYRENRAFVYAGTWPAPYTLSFIEAMMTGIPVMALGPVRAQSVRTETLVFYEVGEFIENGKTGYVLEDLAMLKNEIGNLLQNHKMAIQMGMAGREKAIELFGKVNILPLWKNFLE